MLFLNYRMTKEPQAYFTPWMSAHTQSWNPADPSAQKCIFTTAYPVSHSELPGSDHIKLFCAGHQTDNVESWYNQLKGCTSARLPLCGAQAVTCATLTTVLWFCGKEWYASKSFSNLLVSIQNEGNEGICQEKSRQSICLLITQLYAWVSEWLKMFYLITAITQSIKLSAPSKNRQTCTNKSVSCELTHSQQREDKIQHRQINLQQSINSPGFWFQSFSPSPKACGASRDCVLDFVRNNHVVTCALVCISAHSTLRWGFFSV